MSPGLLCCFWRTGWCRWNSVDLREPSRCFKKRSGERWLGSRPWLRKLDSGGTGYGLVRIWDSSGLRTVVGQWREAG